MRVSDRSKAAFSPVSTLQACRSWADGLRGKVCSVRTVGCIPTLLEWWRVCINVEQPPLIAVFTLDTKARMIILKPEQNGLNLCLRGPILGLFNESRRIVACNLQTHLRR